MIYRVNINKNSKQVLRMRNSVLLISVRGYSVSNSVLMNI